VTYGNFHGYAAVLFPGFFSDSVYFNLNDYIDVSVRAAERSLRFLRVHDCNFRSSPFESVGLTLVGQTAIGVFPRNPGFLP